MLSVLCVISWHKAGISFQVCWEPQRGRNPTAGVLWRARESVVMATGQSCQLDLPLGPRGALMLWLKILEVGELWVFVCFQISPPKYRCTPWLLTSRKQRGCSFLPFLMFYFMLQSFVQANPFYTVLLQNRTVGTSLPRVADRVLVNSTPIGTWPPVPRIGCVTLRELSDLSVSWFPHL